MSRRHDALLALLTLTLVVAISFATGSATLLLEPAPAVVGVVSALLAELGLQQFRQTVRRLWARRRVRVAAIGCVLLVVSGAVVSGTAVVVAVLAWGLVGYLTLLGVVVTGERVARTRR